jgi:BirA family biotin operon repressor/biotin-[acetyl-CoA-carboxylase] ligase
MIKNEKSEQQLKTLLQNINQNYKIEYFSTIDSTNTYAKNLLEKNLNQNLIIVADSQTAGRGRMGRSFYSPDASGLYFSLTIDLQNKNITPSQITAFSGVEVCNTIKEFFKIESKNTFKNRFGKKFLPFLSLKVFLLILVL